MGNKESVIFIYMVNCTICVLFLIQGILMWRAAKPTIEMIHYLRQGGIENIPADLVQHSRVDQFLIQRAKFKYCLFVCFFSTILIFLTTFLRMMITFDTYEKEEKILLSYQAMEGRYGEDAQDEANRHDIDL